MICSKCSTAGVLNTVAGKDFYYCRTCKDEISASAQPTTTGIRLSSVFKQLVDKKTSNVAGVYIPLPITYRPKSTNNGLTAFFVNTLRALYVYDWLPESVDLLDNFCAINRSADTVALAGIRYNSTTNLTVSASIEQMLRRMNIEGANPDIALLPTKLYAKLFKEQGPNIQLSKLVNDQNMEFDAFVLYTVYGKINCVLDYVETASENHAYLLTSKTWALDNDVLVCRQPGANGVVIIK